MDFRNKKLKLGFALLCGVVFLGLAGVIYASGDGHGEGSLSPAKLKDLGWRAVNFAVLAIILVKFLGKPIVNALNSRRMTIVNQFEDLDERRGEVEQTYKKYEAKLGRVDQEIELIVEAAKAQAETEKTRIIEEAERAAEAIKRKAEMSVQQELTVARKKLREDVAEQAAAMAEEIIRKDFKAADQTSMVNNYLDKVGALQ